MSSRRYTRSNVVKRAPQPGQKRRRRMAVLSSVGRESFTCVSSCWQNGQRLPTLPCGTLSSQAGINRKTIAEGRHLLGHSALDGSVVPGGGAQTVEHVRDQTADLTELVFTETACRCRGRPEPKTRRDGGLFRIEGDGVLVARDLRPFEGGLGNLAGELHGPQIDEHQVGVGTAGYDVEPAGKERLGQGLRLGHDLRRVDRKRGGW